MVALWIGHNLDRSLYESIPVRHRSVAVSCCREALCESITIGLLLGISQCG